MPLYEEEYQTLLRIAGHSNDDILDAEIVESMNIPAAINDNDNIPVLYRKVSKNPVDTSESLRLYENGMTLQAIGETMKSQSSLCMKG